MSHRESHTQQRSRNRRLFRIDSQDCDLLIGDPVMAETRIGIDPESRQAVLAEERGLVSAIHYDASDRSLLVEITIHRPRRMGRPPDYLLIEVAENSSALMAGERLTPDTIVGREADTGHTVRAGCYGRVASINASVGKGIWLVLVQVTSRLESAFVSGKMLYKLDAATCHLLVGDRILPEMEIGCHCDTGEPVVSACYGRVIELSRNDADHSLVVGIRPTG